MTVSHLHEGREAPSVVQLGVWSGQGGNHAGHTAQEAEGGDGALASCHLIQGQQHGQQHAGLHTGGHQTRDTVTQCRQRHTLAAQPMAQRQSQQPAVVTIRYGTAKQWNEFAGWQQMNEQGTGTGSEGVGEWTGGKQTL